MNKYTLARLDPRGNGEIYVTLTSGPTFLHRFAGAPVGDDTAFHNFLCQEVESVAARSVTRPPRTRDPAIDARLGVEIVATKIEPSEGG